MRVCFLTKYDEQGASSRVRAYAYRDRLAAYGIECTYAPLMDADYLKLRYRAGAIPWKTVAGSLRRSISRLAAAPKFDALWIEYELVPFGPAVLERLLRAFARPFVVDYDDPIFHKYDLHPSAVVRGLLGGKIDAVMRSANAVTVANDYLGARAVAAGARNCIQIPTVVDLARFPASSAPRRPGPIRIGWIGTPVTARFLSVARAPLRQLAAEAAIEVVVIGASQSPLDGLPVRYVPWSDASEAAELADLDIGIMPLPESPWTKGKSGYKLLQYMAASKPVVGSPVGVNASIVRPGGNGFLASNAAEWLEALRTLCADAGARTRMGAAARATVAERYTYDQTTPVLAKVLKGLVGAA